MDILYYSNYCLHSKKIIQYLVKENLTDSLNCICIDKRSRDQKTGQIYVHLENGSKLLMPPNVHSVPALLMIKQNFRVVLGDEILPILHPLIKKKRDEAVRHHGEPNGFSIFGSTGGMNIVSEQYTMYDASPEELSAKGSGQSRQMHNYVAADYGSLSIHTPPDTYRPDKVGEVTMDKLQAARNEDVSQFFPNNSPYVPNNI